MNSLERRCDIPLAASCGELIRKDLQSGISWAVWVLKTRHHNEGGL